MILQNSYDVEINHGKFEIKSNSKSQKVDKDLWTQYVEKHRGMGLNPDFSYAGASEDEQDVF